MVHENRLFLGNPGAGKSTLINCLVGASKLKSGLSWGGGLTQDYQRVDHDGLAYMDTPGLADTAIAEQAAKAITTALQQGGRYKLFFMMRLQNGRVVSEDLVTIERVLGAIDMASSNIRFSVIFNNVDRKQYNPLTQPDSDAFKFVHRVVNGRQFKTDAFCFIPQIAALDEASDAVVALPQHVREFMDETAPSMQIEPSVVRPVDPTGFAHQARMVQEEMEKLHKSRATMMAAMAVQQQQHEAAMQREREAHADLQSMQSTRGGALSPRYDGGYYAAHPQTPPIGSAVGEPENKSLLNRKKLLVRVGVVAGAAVLITIIVVAVTSGGKSPQPAQPPSLPDLSSTAPTSAPDTVAPVTKWELLGCEDRDVPRNSVHIDWQANITLAADRASQHSKSYFAVSAENTIAVAFNDPKPRRPKQSGQICDASVDGITSWTVYKVIAESKEPLEPSTSPPPTPTETPTTTPTKTPTTAPAQTPAQTPALPPTQTPTN